MKQLYDKKNWLLLFSIIFVCNFITAQNPYGNAKPTNAKMAIQDSTTKAKAQISKVSNKNSKVLPSQNVVPLNIKNQSLPKGKEVSKEKETQLLKKVKEDQNKVGRKGVSEIDINPNDSLSGKVKTFHKGKKSSVTASNLFRTQKSEFALSNIDEMELKGSKSINKNTVYTYQQHHNSIPVEGAVYKVRETNKKIQAFGFVAENIKANANASISAEVGLEKALNAVGARKYVWESSKLSSLLHNGIGKKPTGELVYVGPNYSSTLKEYHLAWKYNIYAIDPQVSQTIYVDATSGKILLKIDLHRDTDVIGNGEGRYSGKVDFKTTSTTEGYKLGGKVSKYNTDIVTWNMNHADFPSDEIITEYIDGDNKWYLNNEDNDEVAIDIQWGTEQAIKYYAEKFDRNSLDDAGMAVIGLAHLGTNVDNASWTGGWTQYGDGSNNNPYTPLAIVAHEVTHGVTQFSANLTYAGESGALNEAFSDILGVSVEFYTGKDTAEEIWELGDELYEYGAMRSFSSPNDYGQPDTYGGAFWADPNLLGFDNGGVHINSGVANFWYYLLVQGDKGVNDIGESYDVSPIGLDKAEKIAYITLTEYLSPSSNFGDMRIATLFTAEDLYGLNSEEYIAVNNAWHAVGVGNGHSSKQMEFMAYEEPVAECGSLTGDESIYITLRNTGEEQITINDTIYYKGSSFYNSRGRLIQTGTYDNTIVLENEVNPGEEFTIAVNDSFIYAAGFTNFVEIYLGLIPITEDNQSKAKHIAFSVDIPRTAAKDNDLDIVHINLPKEKGIELPSNYELTTTIKNLGCSIIPSGTQMQIGYIKNMATDTIWNSYTVDKDWIGEEERDITLDNNMDLSQTMLSTIEVIVNYEEDSNTINNINSEAVVNGSINEFPYQEGFEKTPGGWTSNVMSGTGSWRWQKATFIKFRDIPSEYSWGTLQADDSFIGSNADIALESPVFDFTNVEVPYMQFDINWWFSKGYGGVIVEYSTDNGNSWIKAEQVNYPYSSDFNYTNVLEGAWFTFINNQSQKPAFEAYFPEMGGKKGMIRFRAYTDDSPSNTIGSFVDNIFIDSAPLYDYNLLKSKLKVASCSENNTEGNIEVDFINYGASKELNIDFALEVLKNGKPHTIYNTTKQFTVENIRDTISYKLEHLIDVSEEASYEFNLSMLPHNGIDIDTTDNNDSFSAKGWPSEDLKVSKLPYIMDFEDEKGAIGWKTGQNKGSAGWLLGDATELRSPGWFVTEHTKFMAANDDACDCDAAEDLLISPTFDFSSYSNLYLSFDGFSDSNGFSDGYVKVSEDGGETWEVVYQLPYLAAWQGYDLDLSAYAGKSCVTIAFEHDDNNLYSSGFAIDNIEIRQYANNLEATNLVVSNPTYAEAKGAQFFVSAKNLGVNTVNKVSLKYNIFQNGSPVGNQIVKDTTVSLIPNNIEKFSIDNIPSLAAGTYQIEVEVLQNGDGDLSNNKLSETFEVIENTATLTEETFSIFEEGTLFGTKGWVTNTATNVYSWKTVKTPDNLNLSVPKADHTGDEEGMLLYSQLEFFDNYSELFSPVFELSPNNKTLEFYYAMESNVRSVLIVEIRPIGQTKWEELRFAEKVGSNVDNEWIKEQISLDKYEGAVMLRFRHAKADGYSYLVMDDIKLGNDKVKDLSVEIAGPKSICGVDENVVLKLINRGNVAIDANSIAVQLNYINTDKVIDEIIDVSLQPSEEILYKLKEQPVLDKEYSHSFTITSTLEGDQFEENNNVNRYIYHRAEVDIFEDNTMHVAVGDSIYLDANNNILTSKLRASSFLWSNNETSSGIWVTNSGEYTVTAVLNNGCEITDSINVVYDDFETTLQQGDVCSSADGTVMLTPGKYASYLWFDGSTGSTFTTDQNGDYYVTVYNENGIGKTLFTTINIISTEAPSIVQNGKKLSSSIDAESYQWFLNGRAIPNATKKSIVALWDGEYVLEITNTNTCSATSEIFNTDGLPIGGILNPLRAYPNPTAGDLHLFMANKVEGDVTIKVYDLGGNEVFENKYKEFPEYIDLHNVSQGLYILECTTGGKKYTLKIVRK